MKTKNWLALLLLIPSIVLGSAIISPPGTGGGGPGSDTTAWHWTGDIGTDDTLDFLGTTDAQDLVLKTNSTEMIRLQNGGDIDVAYGMNVNGIVATPYSFNLLQGIQSVTLSPPSVLSASYSLEFPAALPSVIRPLVSSAAGLMTFANSLSLDSLSLPNNGNIIWRNFANSGDLNLKVNVSDELQSDAPILLPGMPTAANHAASKAYVDSISIQVKPNIVAATTVAGTLATSFENGDTIDTVLLATTNRILIKDQALPQENGVYVVQASGAPLRATDSDTWDELVNAYIFVTDGLVNKYSGWRATIVPGGTLNVTPIPFALFSQAGQFTADGLGIELVVNQFQLELDGTTLSKSATGVKVAEANLANFVGDSGSGGVKGVVPAPAAGDFASEKFLSAGGSWLTPDLSAGTVTIDSFNGTGAQVAFTLSFDPLTENNTNVYVYGVYQQKNTYSVVGTTLTFSEAPPTGTNNVEVQLVDTVSWGIAVISDGSITNAKLRDSAALSVIGRAVNSTGVPGDIVAGTDDFVLRRSGTTLGFGQVATGGIANDAITTGKILNGTILTADLAVGAITTAILPAVNYIVSSSSGSFLVAGLSATYVDVTNLSVSLTSTGRPVVLELIADTSGNNGVRVEHTAGGGSVSTHQGTLKFLSGVTTLNIDSIGTTTNSAGSNDRVLIPCSSFRMFTVPAAGTYTYKVQVAHSTGSTQVGVTGCKLVAREL